MAGAADLRPEIVSLTHHGRIREALALVEREIANASSEAHEQGLDLLRGVLLEQLGQQREAVEAFAETLSTGSDLAPWARYRMALAQERLGHPEIAAGLAATLLAREPPDALVEPAMALLDRTLAAGGDCRLLRGIPRERFSGNVKRRRDLMDLRCLARAPERQGLLDGVRDFLSADASDSFAWEALMLFDGSAVFSRHRSTSLMFGVTAYRHRDFDRALELLLPWVDRGLEGPFDRSGREATYAAARSEFWRGNYLEASRRFSRIVDESRTSNERSDALHQLGRSLELSGDTDAAHTAFDRAYHEAPSGDWAAASLLSMLRLEYLRGDESSARRRLTDLAGTAAFATATARGAVFLAVSELVRGRTSGVQALLALAERTREHSSVEIAYWRGRLYELVGESERAIDEYLEVARQRPFHPLAAAARRRTASPPMAAVATERLGTLRQSSDPAALWSAAFLATGRERITLARRGAERLAARPSATSWVGSGLLEVDEWPLWQSPSRRAEEKLLALGLAELAPAAVSRSFPAQRPAIALTGAALLVDGPEARTGLLLAESTFDRRPRTVPLEWVSREFLGTLYPRPWRELIDTQATAQRIDPDLLTAVLREESRFDPEAVSPAAAQGLAQLVLPTARRLAADAGLERISLADLRQPALSVALGAAYVAELHRRFMGDATAIAAAYNAGEDQTALWMRTCVTADPEELLAKIGFRETRAYVTRVLESRNAYRMLAGGGS